MTTSPRACIECGAPAAAVGGLPLCSACALRGALAAAGPTRREALDGAPTPEDSSSAETPQPLPDFELLEEIGRGGMSVVYRARQVSLDRIVTIKMLLPGGSSADQLGRFRAEAFLCVAYWAMRETAVAEMGRSACRRAARRRS